jgi:hypothetical protein
MYTTNIAEVKSILKKKAINTAATQLGVNLSARSQRHKKVFARTNLLQLSKMWPTGLNRVQSIRSIISPCFQVRKQDAQKESSPSNKLLRRYIGVVAVLFVIGSVAPSGAYSEYNNEVTLDAGIVSGVDNYALLADNDG